MPAIKKPYANRDRKGMVFTEPSRTKQSFKQEADINSILEKYSRTGLIPHYDKPQQYGDYTGVIDYHTAMNKIAEGRSAFEDLPSGIRKRFDNDPGQFLDFIADETNFDELVELGLANAKIPEPGALQPDPPEEPAPAGDD